MIDEMLVKRLRALGDPTRLHIVELLSGCCCGTAAIRSDGGVEGPTAGEVCCHITGAERITSTISHHLKELRLAGLITVERRGKHMLCGVNRKAVEALAAYLAVDDSARSADGCC